VLRGVSARRLRLALTLSAIVVGVSFLSGTLVLTATVRQAIREQTGNQAAGLAVSVTPQNGYGSRPSLPSSLAQQIRAVPGVKSLQGEVGGPVVLLNSPAGGGSNTKSVDATAVSTAKSNAVEGLVLQQGRFPEKDDEVAIDASTMQSQDWRIGEQITVGSNAPSKTFTIVGVIGADAAQGLAGTPVAAFDLQTAQRLLGLEGRFTEIDVSATKGITPAILAARIRPVVGGRYSVLTATEMGNRETNSDFRSFSLLSTVLVVLGAIVLFVAAFLVVNTFSIVVAQRTRELGLLRCLGASRSQLMGSVLGESLMVGLLAAIGGVVLGIAGAVALLHISPGIGLDLPSISPQIHISAVIVPILLGTGATLAASILPAIKATSIPPISALRDDPVGEIGRSAGPRATIGAVTLLIGMGLLCAGLFANLSHEGDLVGAGAVLAFVGLASLSPLAARPLARYLGWPLVALMGLPAGLARHNAMRNPRRTASTAAALLVGVALVSFMAVITASARESATGNITEALRAGFIIQADDNGDTPLGNGVVGHLESDKQLQTVVPVSFVRLKIDHGQHTGYAVNLAAYRKVIDLGSIQGNINDLGPHTFAISLPVAQNSGWHVGQTVAAHFSAGTTATLKIAAIFATGDAFGGMLFNAQDPPAGLSGLQTTRVFVDARSGLSQSAALAAVTSAVKGYPQAEISDEAALEAAAISQVNQIVNLITIILILAVLIGLMGIVNTLALSVLERTRELGLLRALGMSRSQIRSMVRHESVIVAVLGAVAGVVVGCLLAWAMQYSLISQGLDDLRVPFVTLLGYIVAAGLCGVVAGILPAKRAAELDVLAAISTE
jgi:putative ABC transport system permease protein